MGVWIRSLEQGVGSGLDYREGCGVWIRLLGQGMGVWIRSWGQGVGVWTRSWGQGVGV